MSEITLKNWRSRIDADHIVWLSLDCPEASVNTLGESVLKELDAFLDALDEKVVKGLVILSGKEKGFIAGADVKAFTQIQSEEEAFALIRRGQLIFDKLSALTIPTVAMVRGICLGGGLELALACRYRVAADDLSTRLGLPEVNLGIHPGWGGTVRLVRIAGPLTAMQVMLTGRAFLAKQAKRQGWVDAAVPLRQLENAARHFILRAPRPKRMRGLARLCNFVLVRPLLAQIFYRELAKKPVQKAHYPAPFAMIKNWVRDGAGQKAMVNEARSVSKLMVTSTAQNLVRVFFLQSEMKAAGKDSAFAASHVHVIGAGVMGGDIAAWCAYKGLTVTLQDQSYERLAPALQRARKLYRKKLKKPHLVQAVMDRLIPDVAGHGVARADVVIEAIFEDLNAKQALFKRVESQLRPGAILATNTSSIPLADIGGVLNAPERLVGIHFFNPVSRMQLVEVVRAEQTDSDCVKAAASFVNQIGRFPLVVASKPGFLVNRILMPYLMEAMKLYEEGTPIAVIDQAALAFGMPMGPITLADKVGLDVCLAVAENLMQHFGGEVPERLKSMVAEGALGQKSGRGFYQYDKKGKPKSSSGGGGSGDLSALADRMIGRLLDEAERCLKDGVVESDDLLDAGMVYGTGFAPFRGGPMQYLKNSGADEDDKRLEEIVSARLSDGTRKTQVSLDDL